MKSVIAVIPNLTPKQALYTFSRDMHDRPGIKWDAGLTSGKLIELGSLSILGRATGLNLSGIWISGYVKEISKTVNWDFRVRHADQGYYWSARKFFEAAAREGNHIIFIKRSRTINKILKNNESKNTLPGC